MPGSQRYDDLASVAEALRLRHLTSEALVTDTLQRIERWNPSVGAITDVLATSALNEARRADSHLGKGAAPSELTGVPVVVKDIMDTTPAVCSAGLPFLADYRPEKDAHVVQRLRRAGAVVVGVSATDPGAFGVKTPQVTHPQAPKRSVGGSSGGSGAALAAGFAFAALGSDTGGSIRIPAACCLVSGLMPTYGRVSTEGVRPLSWSADHVGPLARRSRDLASVARILDPGFDRARAKTKDSKLVVGHAPDYWRDADPGIQVGTEQALEACRDMGAEVRDVSLPSPDDTMEFHIVILAAEAAAYHFQAFPGRLDDYPPVAKALLTMARDYRAHDYVLATRRRTEMAKRVNALFEDVDFLLLPTLPVLPPLRAAETVEVGGTALDFTLALIRYTCLFDHTGNPAVSLPSSVLGPGMGTSVQLVGPRDGDADLLDFAGRLEDALDLSIDHTIRLAADGL